MNWPPLRSNPTFRKRGGTPKVEANGDGFASPRNTPCGTRHSLRQLPADVGHSPSSGTNSPSTFCSKSWPIASPIAQVDTPGFSNSPPYGWAMPVGKL